MTDHRLSHASSAKPPLSVALLCSDRQQQTLLPALLDSGFQAHPVATALELYRWMASRQFDVALLDADLPDEAGFEVAQHLHATTDIGIVMLTSPPQDAIRALHSGADFYLAKPVETCLLTAMLQNFSKRLARLSAAAQAAERLHPMPWRLGAGGWQLVSPLGGIVALAAAERSLIQALLREGGQVVSRRLLIEAVAHNANDFDPHRLEMIIHRLRRKVAAQTGELLPLRTVRAKGYRLDAGTSPL